MSAVRRSTPKKAAARGAGRRRRRGRASRATLIGAVALAALALSAQSASAAPFQCDAFGYLFQTQSGAANTDIVQVDLATGVQNPIGVVARPPATASGPVNAVAYNSVDDYFYGMQAIGPIGGPYTWGIVRIHTDGSIDQLGMPPGMDPNQGFHVGDVDPAGHYWVTDGVSWFEIDLTTPAPTMVDTGTITLPAPLVNMGADWGWINGGLYSVGQDAGAANSYLVRFNPANGATANLGAVNVPGGGIGAVFVDAAGYLYASQNATNIIYRIDPATRQTIIASDGDGTSPGNDGARCALAPVPTITVTKTVDGRVRAADQFTVGLRRPDGSLADAATTSGAVTTASTVNFPASQGQTYTITDAMAGGSPTPIGEYLRSIACTDGNGNPVPVGGTGPTWTLNVASAANYRCNVTNKASSDLEIEKTASPSPAVPGENVTYSLKVTNDGPSTAINTRVSDPLPRGLTFVSAGAGCANVNGTVTCATASLAPGASHTFTVTARVASSVQACSEIRNTATVTSDIADPDLSDNEATTCPQLEGRVDLSITKTPSRTSVPSGAQVMYTLVIRNNGPSDDTGVLVTDPMATGLSLVAAKPSQGSCATAGGKLSCTMGSLPADGSMQVLVTAIATAPGGTITNTSTVTGDKKEIRTSNNTDSATVTVTPGPDPRFDLVVDKRASTRSAYVGQPVSYRIVVTNKGPQAAPGAALTDTFNESASVVSVKTTQGECTERLPMRCTLGSLRAGARVTITVVIKPRDNGCRQRNAASATGQGTDATPADNLDRVTLCARSVPLRLSKVADAGSVAGGGLMSYTIRVSNRTRGEARDVQVCDRLPAGLAYVSSRSRARLTKGQYCWTLNTLKARSSKRYRITVRALRGATGNVVNRATASAPGARRARASDPVRVAGVRVGGGVTG